MRRINERLIAFFTCVANSPTIVEASLTKDLQMHRTNGAIRSVRTNRLPNTETGFEKLLACIFPAFMARNQLIASFY